VSARLATALVTASLAALAGCGDGDEDDPGVAVVTETGEGGTVAWALAERPRQLDPLLAVTEADELVSRQIHEPLVESVVAPFESGVTDPGLALRASSNSDANVWRVRLRPGVTFQDGEQFNADAVLANARRWQESPVAGELLPDFLVDAPRPGHVRFILEAPDPHFGVRLAAARLGIVSPGALPRSPTSPAPAQAGGTGTGPFELRERSPERLLLARNAEWWGTARGLGPAIDQLEFLAVSEADERLDLLADGTIQAAALGPMALERASDDPLLTVIGDEIGLAVERSLRGITADEGIPMLNDIWRTEIPNG
jgi:peptide/nickel transport system substrate-binding protein